MRPHGGPVLVALVALLLVSSAPARRSGLTPGSRYHSARCIAFGRACDSRLARRAGACIAGRRNYQQPPTCIRGACQWCDLRGQAAAELCRNRAIRQLCRRRPTKPAPRPAKPARRPTRPTPRPAKPGTRPAEPTPRPSKLAPRPSKPSPRPARPAPLPAKPAPRPAKPTPRPTKPAPRPAPRPSKPSPPRSKPALGPARSAPTGRQPAGSCTWRGNDQVSISLELVKPATGWTPVRRSGLSGLVFRPDLNRGLAQPGSGEMCFPVRLDTGGSYFMTFLSYSAGRTEHNDAWVKSSKRMRLWKIRGNRWFDVPANTYLKAFQNHGPSHGLSHVMKNKDNDGHRFTVLGVQPGETITACLSGRSFKFEVYRIVLVKCRGDLCNGGNLFRNDVLSVPVSQCF